jgi:hypothetical protein
MVRYMAGMEHPPVPAAIRHTRPRTAKEHADRSQTEIVARRDPNGGEAMHTIRFGDVTVTAPRPSDEEIRRNVEASTAALKRALPAFLRPGVRIYPKKDVPLFWADEDDPNVCIRKLNGKIERGVVDEDGQFKVID